MESELLTFEWRYYTGLVRGGWCRTNITAPRFTRFKSCQVKLKEFAFVTVLLTLSSLSFPNEVNLNLPRAQSNDTENWCYKASPKDDEYLPLSEDSAPYLQLRGTEELILTEGKTILLKTTSKQSSVAVDGHKVVITSPEQTA